VVGQRQGFARLGGQVGGVRLGQAEQRARLGRRLAFHADVPQNRAPALGQRHERRHDQIGSRPAGLGGAWLTVPGPAGRLTRHGDGGLADGRQEVRAERVGWSASSLDRGENVLEGQIDSVFGGGAARQQELGKTPRGRHVSPSQQPVGARVARANRVENIRVAAASSSPSG
jgi:hypothetical protein